MDFKDLKELRKNEMIREVKRRLQQVNVMYWIAFASAIVIIGFVIKYLLQR